MIVPAILTKSKNDFVKMIDSCATFAECLQIDIMDGKFVPSQSITVNELDGIKCSIDSEAHLMVNNPLEWLDVFKKIGSRRIIFHYEIKADHLNIIKAIKKAGFQAGIGINPSTNLDDFRFLLDDVDSILFMSVNPGFYGAAFIPQVLEKIKTFKQQYPQIITGIDGGVKLDNVLAVKASGVDYICVGSAILQQPNPKDAYKKFKELAYE